MLPVSEDPLVNDARLSLALGPDHTSEPTLAVQSGERHTARGESEPLRAPSERESEGEGEGEGENVNVYVFNWAALRERDHSHCVRYRARGTMEA